MPSGVQHEQPEGQEHVVQEGGGVLVGLKPLFAVGFLPAKDFPPSL